MADFRIDERDVAFALYEWLDLDRLLGMEKYADYDIDTIKMVVNEAAKFVVEQVAPTNEQGDVQGARRLEDGTVKYPEAAQC